MKDQLIKIFSEKYVLTLVDLKRFLQTSSRMTVFRKLKQLPYKSSYSHCGKYYTLDNFAQYNKHEVWGFNQIYFSLKSNVKKISSGGKSMTQEERKKRDTQFEYINEQHCQSYQKNFPQISVDTKKKELIGNFKNQGTRYKCIADLTGPMIMIFYLMDLEKRLYMAFMIH